jgi:hypothetical protein
MDSNEWELVLARLPVSAYDSVSKVNKQFWTLIKKRWRTYSLQSNYEKYHDNTKTYMVIVSFKDSYHCEGFFIKTTHNDKKWFEGWFMSKFGQGVSNFIIYECDPQSLIIEKNEYITIPNKIIKKEDIIISDWIGRVPIKMRIIWDIDYGQRYGKYEKYFRFAHDSVYWHGSALKFNMYDIFSAIHLCNFNYILSEWNTLIDYDQILSFNLEDKTYIKSKENILSQIIECDKCYHCILNKNPYDEVRKWFEVERIERAKTKSTYYACSHEFFSEKRRDKIFIKWTNLRGLYFTLHQRRHGDDFISVFEDTMARTYLIISCIGGHPVITYPGYYFTLSGGETNSPDNIIIGRILPEQKDNYNRTTQHDYAFNPPLPEKSPNELIDIIFDWANNIIIKRRNK